MASDPFSISHSTPDVLLYDEGEGRTVEFQCRPGNDLTAVAAPAENMWAFHTPTWAHERRTIILQRLRASGLIVYETSQLLISVLSPDGTCRVEAQWEPDDRAPAWETLQITTVPDNRIILRLPLYSFADNVEFSRPGIAVIALLGRHGQRDRLRFNAIPDTI